MWYFLRTLWEEDGLSHREISRRVGATAATTTEQLRNMERRGLVTRHPSKSDRRMIHFFLTERGSALEARLVKYPLEVELVALAGLAPAEVGFLRLALIRIDQNLAAEFGRDSEEIAVGLREADDDS